MLQNPQDCYWRVAVDSQYVYWSSGSLAYSVGCAGHRVSIDGGAPTTLIDQPYLLDFAVDGVNVYFSAQSSIRRVSVDGADMDSVTDSGPVAWVLTDYSTDLYWLDLRFGRVGQISKLPETPISDWSLFPVMVESNTTAAIEGIFVDGSGIYYSETPTGTIGHIY